MPLNVMGGQRVYTVPEIDMMMKKMAGFTIVDKLPAIASANPTLVYYKKTKDKVRDITGYANPDDPTDIAEEEDAIHTEPVYTERPALIPYIIGNDAVTGDKVWYTTGNSVNEQVPLTDDEINEIWDAIDFVHTTLKAGKHLALKEGQ